MRPLSETVVLGWGTASHPGQQRVENQDAFVARPPVFLVADGMGGHAAGKQAAELVAQSFDTAIGGGWVTPQDLHAATDSASGALRGLAEHTSGSPGSTVTGVAIAQHQERPAWLVFNIGDSRTYLVSDGRMEQVTVDHSRVQELLDHGVADIDARQRVSSNVITRAIGGGLRAVPELDQWLVPMHVGDRVLVCSDGLTGELSDSLIAATLLATSDPAEAADALQQAAVAAGGRDNVTVVVVDVVRLDVQSHPDGLLEGDTLTDLLVVADPESTHPDPVTAPIGWVG